MEKSMHIYETIIHVKGNRKTGEKEVFCGHYAHVWYICKFIQWGIV